MKDLLEFIIKNITGTQDFTVSQKEEGERIIFEVVAPQESIGLIIGKGGKTIKNIRKILSVPAVLEHRGITINVNQAQ